MKIEANIYKAYFLVALFSIVFSGIVSAHIEVSPPTIDLDLVGGDTVTEQITIIWKGEAPVVGFIETTIMPDGVGINVTYSENPVILIPNIPKTVDMIINVAINIMPDSYVITTIVLTEIEEIIEYRSGGTTIIYKEIIVENLTRINELLLIIQQLQDQINQTANCTECLSLIDMLQDTIDELLAIIEDASKEEPEPEKLEPDEPYDWTGIFFVFIIMICILCCIICYAFWVLKSRTEKQVKDETKVSGDNERGPTGPENK